LFFAYHVNHINHALLPFVGSGSGLINVSLFIVATDKDISLMFIKDTLFEPHALHDNSENE